MLFGFGFGAKHPGSVSFSPNSESGGIPGTAKGESDVRCYPTRPRYDDAIQIAVHLKLNEPDEVLTGTVSRFR